ncbi:MAG: glycoside hydrolase family 1 protein [Schleiferilactobacillus harbinensis]|jgi:beta-glucosidase|nr:glycoside hydrolase family 1 protein [Schleiferilactobacillus harbinensis]MCI1911422.1 glycoside hydrolase family 1 protein [Schleiferilactobacillus harbinensis]
MQIPEGFMLGAASSAWQTEGWHGKKAGQDSYLDDWFKHEYFVWHAGKGPDVATDFMTRYSEDVALMKEIGLSHYRTSINWSRFFTDYENLVVDEDYADHVNNVINALISANVEPMIAIEHYEVPQFLIDKYDGWNSKRVVDLFVGYAKILFERYGDRVHQWFTFNEPIVPQTRIHLDGLRYPHDLNPKKWMQCNYNKVLATALTVQAFRSSGQSGRIGIIHNWELAYPRATNNQLDVLAAKRFDLLYNRVFTDPLIKGDYSPELIKLLSDNHILFNSTDEELALIKANTIDVIGLNLYFPKRVKTPEHQWDPSAPFNPRKYYSDFELPGRKMNNSRGWEIYPPMMYDMAKVMRDDYNNFPWFISENGMGIENERRFKNSSGQIQDDYRINFISEHLWWLLKAVHEGANCEGYMLWAFTDNVSPMNAFKNRYGLVEIDLEDNLARHLKKSGLWYHELIETKQLNYSTRFAYRSQA